MGFHGRLSPGLALSCILVVLRRTYHLGRERRGRPFGFDGAGPHLLAGEDPGCPAEAVPTKPSRNPHLHAYISSWLTGHPLHHSVLERASLASGGRLSGQKLLSPAPRFPQSPARVLPAPIRTSSPVLSYLLPLTSHHRAAPPSASP